MKEKDSRASNPQNYVYRFGIVERVPTSFTEKEILQWSTFRIKKFSKSNWRNSENLAEFLLTLKFTFEGSDLPEKIVFDYTRLNVEYYIPKLCQCGKSGRLGHFSSHCKALDERCLKCGKTPACNDACDHQPWPPSPRQILPKMVGVSITPPNNSHPEWHDSKSFKEFCPLLWCSWFIFRKNFPVFHQKEVLTHQKPTREH